MIKFGVINDFHKDRRVYRHLGFFKFPKLERTQGYIYVIRFGFLILPCVSRDWDGHWLRM
jgi:hypothetical protein